MANIPSAMTYLNDVEVASDAPITQSLFSRIGSGINYLNDRMSVVDPIATSMPSSSIIQRSSIFSVTCNQYTPDFTWTVAGTLMHIDLTMYWSYYAANYPQVTYLSIPSSYLRRTDAYPSIYLKVYVGDLDNSYLEAHLKWVSTSAIKLEFTGNVGTGAQATVEGHLTYLG